jgi:hypothetical protein
LQRTHAIAFSQLPVQSIKQGDSDIIASVLTMSVGFGFSVGDFIAALELVATVVDALRESGESSTEFRALVTQLHTLQTALESVSRLEIDDAQQGEAVALQQAAAQCQKSINGFWEKIKKYQPSLRTGESRNKVKDGWMKIKWAVCKKEDLLGFKMDLVAHTESIQMMLATLQMQVDSSHVSKARMADGTLGQLHVSTRGRAISVIRH